MSQNQISSALEHPKANITKFYLLLINSLLANVTNMTVWFALIFFIYLQTQAVLATSIISGIYLVSVSLTGIWFGSLVDNYHKKSIMLLSSLLSLTAFVLGFIQYMAVDFDIFSSISNIWIWLFVITLMIGVVAGNIRGIAMPTLVTILIPEDSRDKANGLLGTTFGIVFLIVSVISGLLVGHSGMYLVLILAIIMSVISIVHLWLTPIPEKKIVHLHQEAESIAGKKIDIQGTIKVIKTVPGLITLILFTTFNNFLGGVFMSLMDAYGLSLVSVQVWGLLWGLLSTAFIIGGIVIAKRGLGKNPLRSLFTANIIIWVISCLFTLQPWIALLMAGMFIYLAVVPFIEAAEHTIIQKVVPVDRQGRVFGFAQSVEQAASPLTSFLIGPIAQFIFIPFMTTGAGVNLIGSWFGSGPDRGIALVFTITGIIGLSVTLLAKRSSFYKRLAAYYAQSK